MLLLYLTCLDPLIPVNFFQAVILRAFMGISDKVFTLVVKIFLGSLFQKPSSFHPRE